MADIEIVTSLPWSGGAGRLESVTSLPWTLAGRVETIGSPFEATVGGGGTPITGGSLEPKSSLGDASNYDAPHTLSAVDLRDDSPLAIESATISFEDGSLFWQLRAEGGGELFAQLTGGEQPAQVGVTIDGQEWRFVIETINRPRAFSSDRVSFGGRSVAAGADTPYQFEQQWISDAPTTAAQVATGAQVFTELEVRWTIEDWAIPEGVLAHQGSPISVVRAVAAAAGANVVADRKDFAVSVVPRYQLQPPQWACVGPDAQVHFSAVISEVYEIANKPSYDAIYLSGQQQGVLGYCRKYGTAGANLAPMVTDPLLTDIPALRQRAESILGGFGPQSRITRVLPVLVGEGQPGVFDPGWLTRWTDPDETWFGVVRAVSVTATLGSAVQTVTIERHAVELVEPEPEGFVFDGPIPDQTYEVDVPFSVDLSGYWSGGDVPLSYSLRSGTLPAGLTLNATTGVISGTPTDGGGSVDIAIRAVDQSFRQSDSNVFSIGPDLGVVFLLDVDGATPADKSGYDTTFAFGTNPPVVSTEQSKWSGRSLKVSGAGSWATALNAAMLNLPEDTGFTLEGWVYISTAANYNVPAFGVAGDDDYLEAGYSGTARYVYGNTAGLGAQLNGFTLVPQVIVPASAWVHFAVVRPSGVSTSPRFYMGGQYRGTSDAPFSLAVDAQNKVGLGYWRGGEVNNHGTLYLEDVRLRLNVEVYTGTGAYTPPDEAF